MPESIFLGTSRIHCTTNTSVPPDNASLPTIAAVVVKKKKKKPYNFVQISIRPGGMALYKCKRKAVTAVERSLCTIVYVYTMCVCVWGGGGKYWNSISNVFDKSAKNNRLFGNSVRLAERTRQSKHGRKSGNPLGNELKPTGKTRPD